MSDPTTVDDFEQRIARRAEASGLVIEAAAIAALAQHACAVLHASPELHLTTITGVDEFVERHVGETFEGAAMLDAPPEGLVVDLGSGNGYPGIPLTAVHPGLRVILAEASRRKSEFLRRLVAEIAADRATVLEVHVQRPADLEGIGAIRVLTSRAMGGWAKILPRLVPALAADGEILLWAGAEVETVARRVVWRRLRLVDRRALPGREASWIWRFRPS